MSINGNETLMAWPRRYRHWICVLLLGLFPALTASASEEWSSTLERLNRRAAEVTDLTADFEESKYTTLMKEPLVTRGRVRILGERSRWDTESPTQMVMTVDPTEVKLYYPDRNSLEIFSIDARLQPLIVSPVSSLSRLQAQFNVEPSPDEDTRQADASNRKLLALILTPIEASMRQYVERIRLMIDTETAYVREVELQHPDGDRTVIRFSRVQVNTGLSESDITLVVPPGTKTHRVEKPVQRPK